MNNLIGCLIEDADTNGCCYWRGVFKRLYSINRSDSWMKATAFQKIWLFLKCFGLLVTSEMWLESKSLNSSLKTSFNHQTHLLCYIKANMILTNNLVLAWLYIVLFSIFLSSDMSFIAIYVGIKKKKLKLLKSNIFWGGEKRHITLRTSCNNDHQHIVDCFHHRRGLTVPWCSDFTDKFFSKCHCMTVL